MTRLTLDLDEKKMQVIAGKAMLLKLAFPTSDVMYRKSSSGNGGHVLMYTKDDSISEQLQYNIRYLLGDHDKRIAIDYAKGRFRADMPKQVLFDYKIYKCSLRNKCKEFDPKKCRFRRNAGEWINMTVK